jgi:cytidylate kinase
MRITVSGLPGSGTTSLSRHLARQHNLDMISAGEVFRQLAREHNLELAEFGHLAENDPSFDRMIDERQRDIAKKQDNIIIEGRLSGWMVPHADLRIWLFAPLGCRVGRIITRDGVADDTTAQRLTLEREACEAQRYRTYYNIDINDLSIYHIVLNSEKWGVDGLGGIVDAAVRAIPKSESGDK